MEGSLFSSEALTNNLRLLVDGKVGSALSVTTTNSIVATSGPYDSVEEPDGASHY